jgi:hypothetical protein
MEKEQSHIALYMPVWTEDELQFANFERKCGLTEQEISKRFQAAGGSARLCLAHPAKYIAGIKEVKTKAREIDSFPKLKAIIDQNAGTQDLRHSVLHMTPVLDVDNYPSLFSLEFRSPEILLEVDSHLVDKTLKNRLEVTRWLGGDSLLAGVSGYFFEGAFKEILRSGGFFTFDSLNGFPSLQVDIQSFIASPSTNTEGIDGTYFCEETNQLFAFQCTVSERHPVKAMGIIKAIETLRINPSSVVLVFVVPNNKREFKLQRIDFRYPQTLTQDSDISLIHGVGPFIAEKLSKVNVNTVGQLRALVRAERGNEKYNLLIANLDRDIFLEKKYKSLAEIPQYRLTLPDFV